MKPICVSFQCFGPYLERQEIDFAALGTGGLFLITGETGSGKTTILDAICCALYGEASNKSRGELDALRCKTADDTQETRVSFVFETNGRRYKFVRSLRRARINWIDEHNCMEYMDGVYVPVFENPKKTRVNDMARALIGLTAEQFRQVIVLPQGKFETLLTSDSGGKEEILTSIFHTDRWDGIERAIKASVDERRKTADEQAADIRRTLQSFGCGSADELDEKLVGTRAQAEELQKELQTLEKEKDDRRREATQALLDSEAFDALERTRAELDALEQRRADMLFAQKKLLAARQAETVRAPYSALQAAEQAVRQAETAGQDAQRACDTARKKHATAREAQQKLAEQKDAYTASTETLRRLRDAQAVYAERTRTAEALRLAKADARAAEQAAEKRKAAQQTRADEVRRCGAQLDAAEEIYRDIRRRYLRSVSGNLAQNLLHDGEPCPVCGSADHPSLPSRRPTVCGNRRLTRRKRRAARRRRHSTRRVHGSSARAMRRKKRSAGRRTRCCGSKRQRRRTRARAAG